MTELTWRQPLLLTSNFVWKTGIVVTKNAYLTLFLVGMSQIILKEDNYLPRFMAAVGRSCYTQWHAVPWIALCVFQIKTFELNHTGPSERQKDHSSAFHTAIPCKQLLLFSSSTTLEAMFASGKERSNSYWSMNCPSLCLQELEEGQKTLTLPKLGDPHNGAFPYRSNQGNRHVPSFCSHSISTARLQLNQMVWKLRQV